MIRSGADPAPHHRALGADPAEHRPHCTSRARTSPTPSSRSRWCATSEALAEHLGIAAGDRVAYLGYNRPEMLVLLFALARIGAMLLPLNFRLALAEHAGHSAACRAKRDRRRLGVCQDCSSALRPAFPASADSVIGSRTKATPVGCVSSLRRQHPQALRGRNGIRCCWSTPPARPVSPRVRCTPRRA